MFQQVISDFNYQDDSKKISAFIKKNYPNVKLLFDKKKKELVVYSKNKKQVSVVYNMLYIINRFDLQIPNEK